MLHSPGVLHSSMSVNKSHVQFLELQHHDASQPITLQVEALQTGLTAAILQNAKLVAYASKTLSATEYRTPNIERDFLVMMFGCECICTYI